MQGFVFSVLRVLFGILDSAQIGFGVLGVFWGVFLDWCYFIHRVFFSFGGEGIVWTGMFPSRMSRLIMCGRRLLILRMMRGCEYRIDEISPVEKGLLSPDCEAIVYMLVRT